MSKPDLNDLASLIDASAARIKRQETELAASPLTDDQMASVIKTGVDTLNKIIGEAIAMGLAVDLDIVPLRFVTGAEKPILTAKVSRPL